MTIPLLCVVACVFRMVVHMLGCAYACMSFVCAGFFRVGTSSSWYSTSNVQESQVGNSEPTLPQVG